MSWRSAASELNIPCVSVAEADAAGIPILSRHAVDRRPSAPSTCSTPNISAASTRSISPWCTMTASLPDDLERGRHRPDRHLAARRKRRPAIYLANRGIKTANIPLVLGVPSCRRSLAAPSDAFIVGLVASAERIVPSPPEPRAGARRSFDLEDYVDRATIAEEIALDARALCAPRLADDRRDTPLDRRDGGGDHPPLP